VLDLGRFHDRIVARREIPPRAAETRPLPAALSPELRAALESLGVEQLWSHQDEMYARARAGENLVITTGTASGKSLAFLLPVLQKILEEPSSRALLLYPTKALGQDQLRKLLQLCERFAPGRLEAGVYDGDTPPTERSRIRDGAHLILSNPDMLNTAFLPNHGRRGFSHLFRNLRFVVVDEAHIYRGAFGAHFANLMRRLRRICRHYGSDPQFLCSSATIANPCELAENLMGQPFGLVEHDGSPAAGKTVHFWLPPLLASGQRRSVAREMAGLLPELVQRRHRFIAFCRSRKETEIVLKESRDALRHVPGGHDESALLAGYRGGYTPAERREVEQGLLSAKLQGVVSTNALELGVDIGALELVVQAGFPGTRASFWQQIGRAGRRGRDAHAVLLLAPVAVDQYIGLDPDWLMGRPSEQAVLDPDNLVIQLAHARAAAAELPLTVDDLALFPDLGEILPVLQNAGELREVYGSYHWQGSSHPAGDFSLRNIDGDRFKIVDRILGRTITEMDRPQTYREAFPRAVYLHDGVQYLVETLDLVGRVATVVPVEQNYYTQPDVRTAIEVLNVQERRTVAESRAWFGDLRVTDTTVGYKMLEFHNHQNLGYELLDPELPVQLETEGLWLAVPPEVLRVFAASGEDPMLGMVHALRSVARMRTMAERSDLQGTSFHYLDELQGETLTALVLYDSHPGGLGFASRCFDAAEDLVAAAHRLLLRCPCPHGCPACVGDVEVDPQLVAWGLQSLLATCPPPPGWAGLEPAPRPAAATSLREELGIEFGALPERFAELQAALLRRKLPGAQVLAQVRRAELRGARLVLEFRSPGAADWVNMEANRQRLGQVLAQALDLPRDFALEARCDPEALDAASRAAHKLRRRHEELSR